MTGPSDLLTWQLHHSLSICPTWVPAHVGIAGNETADRLAKAAVKLPHLTSPPSRPFEAGAEINLETEKEYYDLQKDQFNTLDRRIHTIFLLHGNQDPSEAGAQIDLETEKEYYDLQKDQFNTLDRRIQAIFLFTGKSRPF